MVDILASITPNKTCFGPLLFPGQFDTALTELAKLKYTGIELSLRTCNDISQNKLFTELKRNGLQLLSIATGQSYIDDGYSLFATDKDKREKAVKRIKEFIHLASNTGASVILGGIRGNIETLDNSKLYNNGIDAIKECLETAEQKHVLLLLEAVNRYETNVFNSVTEAAEAVISLGSDYIKVLADTYHMNIEEVSMTTVLEKYSDYIGAIHLADNNRLAPGMGHIDFGSIIEVANRLPFLKYLGVEVLPKPASSICAEIAMKTIMNYL